MTEIADKRVGIELDADVEAQLQEKCKIWRVSIEEVLSKTFTATLSDPEYQLLLDCSGRCLTATQNITEYQRKIDQLKASVDTETFEDLFSRCQILAQEINDLQKDIGGCLVSRGAAVFAELCKKEGWL